MVTWQDDVPARAWDETLATLGGHPRQSAVWEDIRTRIDGAHSRRWMAVLRGEPACLIRFERHDMPVLGRVAWCPRGPTSITDEHIWFPSLRQRLIDIGIEILVTDLWQEISHVSPPSMLHREPTRTIWIDLSAGRDELWRQLDKQWRYGVNRAERLGVIAASTRDPEEIKAFCDICRDVSVAKGFDLRLLPPALAHLLGVTDRRDFEALLFVARCEGRVAAGAFIIRFGNSAFYFWGGTDRRFSKERVGEAVQWAVIEWAVGQGLWRYDLEGVDPEKHRGVYDFKRKMGGREVELVGQAFTPLNPAGRERLDRYRGAA